MVDGHFQSQGPVFRAGSQSELFCRLRYFRQEQFVAQKTTEDSRFEITVWSLALYSEL